MQKCSNEQKPVMIIPREKAVFRLDKNGEWRINNEKFTNQKIIRYFHSVIKKDENGYFLEQEHKHFIEKVYFPYEDTALFVFRVIRKDVLILCLSTGENIRLDPEKLLMRNDSLYLRNNDEELIKFNADAILSLADYMDDAEGQYFINLDGKRHRIPGME